MNAPAMRGSPSRSIRYGIAATLFVISVPWLLIPALRQEHFGIAAAPEGLMIQDFAGHLRFTKAFWKGQADYDVESHLRVASAWLGQPVQRALPFGYSPTMLFVLAPLCLVPTVWAYVIWTLLGIAAASWMITWSIWIGAAVVSPAALAALALGQTAVFTAAALLLLVSRDVYQSPLRDRRVWLSRSENSGKAFS